MTDSEKGKPLVLVVDDDPGHFRLLELLADRLQITVYKALSCDEALKAMQLAQFDLVLMDYRMPEVDGCACTLKVRQMNKQAKNYIPIVAVTGFSTELVRNQCLGAGMDDFLAKPFTIEELSNVLRRWLRREGNRQAIKYFIC